MLDIKQLTARLSKPLWLEGADIKYTWKPDAYGVFNIYWVLTGKPTLDQVTLDHFKQHSSLWVQASNLAARIVDGVPVEMTATVLKPADFAKWLAVNVKGVESRKFRETV